jgi:hypothetical protein
MSQEAAPMAETTATDLPSLAERLRPAVPYKAMITTTTTTTTVYNLLNFTCRCQWRPQTD